MFGPTRGLGLVHTRLLYWHRAGSAEGEGALALLSVAMSVQEPGQTLWPVSRSKCMIYPFEGRGEGARWASPRGVGKDAELQAAM